MKPIPAALLGRSFTIEEAQSHGITRRMLQGRRWVQVHRGVYRAAETEASLELMADAALQSLGPGHVLSHLTALRLRGLTFGPPIIHLATNRPHQKRVPGVVVHRYLHDVIAQQHNGRFLTTVERMFVDLGTLLNDRHLLSVGDWLVSTGQIDLDQLRAFALDSHLDGVQRARRVIRHVRRGVESVRESDVRWIIIRAGLPVPETNPPILDNDGRQLARGDMVYAELMILVEYDGWQHERDAEQRQWDHLRRETLEAAGWRVIVITAADMAHPHSVAIRIHQALRQRGYQGPGPRFAR